MKMKIDKSSCCVFLSQALQRKQKAERLAEPLCDVDPWRVWRTTSSATSRHHQVGRSWHGHWRKAGVADHVLSFPECHGQTSQQLSMKDDEDKMLKLVLKYSTPHPISLDSRNYY